ncbi:MAG: hypothetical protein P8103_19895 [Candidatus Thiodiazotropha sp.]
MAKPADFYLGAIEFFGVLLPGAALCYSLLPLLAPTLPADWLPRSSTQAWAVFAVLSYIVGHLLHAIGSSVFDGYVYDRFYVSEWKPTHRRVATLIGRGDKQALLDEELAAKSLLARVYLETETQPGGSNYYDWCLSAIRLNAPEGAQEVDRLQADSKFFRSMSLVFLVVAAVSLVEELIPYGVGAAVLALFSAWRFCTLRWTATKRVYEYHLLACTEAMKTE